MSSASKLSASLALTVYRVASEGKSPVRDVTGLYSAVRLARSIATIDGTMVNVWTADRYHRPVAFAQAGGAVLTGFGATAEEHTTLTADWS